MKLIDIFQRVFNRLPIYLVQFKSLVKKKGIFFTLKKIFKKIFRFVVTGGDGSKLMRIQYGEWMSNIESKYLNEESMREDMSKLKVKPEFSIIFPVWNKSEEMLQKALDSITNQIYENWEICISDGSSENIKETREYLKEFQNRYSEKVKFSAIDVKGINLIENSNNAISMATGEYVVFMDCDDEISPNCLLELAKGINSNPKVEFLYSDFDKIDEQGNRFDPSFWPDWSPHTLTSQMYTTHVTCYRRDVLNELGNLVKGTQGAQDWDLVLRYVTRGRWNVIHIPKILYHWRVYPGSTALANSGSKDWAYEKQRFVLERYLERRKLEGEVIEGAYEGSWRVKFKIMNNPKVSIVIPTRDKVEYLRRAIDSIREKTKYQNYEIVIVDNQSKEKDTLEYFEEIGKEKNIRIIEYDKPFHFGKLYNWASKQIDGEYMLILNNDIEVINDDWLESMLEWCQLPEVGSVGAKLYYPNGKIQHAGVIVGAGGAAAHSHRLLHRDSFGYEGALVNVRDYLALTGACLMVRRELFINMNGFDESFDPAYQDVDFGIRLYERGLYNVYTPYSQLIHYESVTRFDEMNKRDLESDESNALKLRKKWPKYIEYMDGNDPFYNENLSYAHEDFRLRTN